MQYCQSPYVFHRRVTREVVVGDPARGGVILGGHHPVVKQSMLTCDTMDTDDDAAAGGIADDDFAGLAALKGKRRGAKLHGNYLGEAGAGAGSAGAFGANFISGIAFSFSGFKSWAS